MAESPGFILTSWRKSSAGQLCRRRNSRKDAFALPVSDLGPSLGPKYDSTDGCKNGDIPLIFQLIIVCCEDVSGLTERPVKFERRLRFSDRGGDIEIDIWQQIAESDCLGLCSRIFVRDKLEEL